MTTYAIIWGRLKQKLGPMPAGTITYVAVHVPYDHYTLPGAIDKIVTMPVAEQDRELPLSKLAAKYRIETTQPEPVTMTPDPSGITPT